MLFVKCCKKKWEAPWVGADPNLADFRYQYQRTKNIHYKMSASSNDPITIFDFEFFALCKSRKQSCAATWVRNGHNPVESGVNFPSFRDTFTDPEQDITLEKLLPVITDSSADYMNELRGHYGMGVTWKFSGITETANRVEIPLQYNAMKNLGMEIPDQPQNVVFSVTLRRLTQFQYQSVKWSFGSQSGVAYAAPVAYEEKVGQSLVKKEDSEHLITISGLRLVDGAGYQTLVVEGTGSAPPPPPATEPTTTTTEKVTTPAPVEVTTTEKEATTTEEPATTTATEKETTTTTEKPTTTSTITKTTTTTTTTTTSTKEPTSPASGGGTPGGEAFAWAGAPFAEFGSLSASGSVNLFGTGRGSGSVIISGLTPAAGARSEHLAASEMGYRRVVVDRGSVSLDGPATQEWVSVDGLEYFPANLPFTELALSNAGRVSGSNDHPSFHIQTSTKGRVVFQGLVSVDSDIASPLDITAPSNLPAVDGKEVFAVIHGDGSVGRVNLHARSNGNTYLQSVAPHKQVKSLNGISYFPAGTVLYPLSLAAGQLASGGDYVQPAVRRENNVVFLRGMVTMDGVTNQIATLGFGDRPPASMTFITACLGKDFCQIRIESDGLISLLPKLGESISLYRNTRVSLSGIHYPFKNLNGATLLASNQRALQEDDPAAFNAVVISVSVFGGVVLVALVILVSVVVVRKKRRQNALSSPLLEASYLK
jgi:hypothetical protein